MLASTTAASSSGNRKFSSENDPHYCLNETNLQNTLKGTDSIPLPAEEKSRGRRMMGVLMGTLSKFKSEEEDKSEANLKRILLEQRLAQKLLQAKEQLQEHRPLLKDHSLTSEVLLQDILQIKSSTDEACSHFQQTDTLPRLYFQRAQN